MTDYYNEIDPYAAQFLRNLIEGGHIPFGHVDTRSIEDVTPADLAGYTQCHFFAGLGGWPLALQLAGWPRDRPVWTGSCPCQPFSAAGKGDGFADERHLWPAWHHLIAQCRPAVVFGEQVASAAAAPWIDLVHADVEGLDYTFGCIPFPAAGVGAPHIRDRNYWVAHSDHERRFGQRVVLRAKETGSGSGDFPKIAGGRGLDGVADTSSIGRIRRRPGEACTESRTVERPDGLRDARGLADSHGREQQRLAVVRGDECDGSNAGWQEGLGRAAARSDHGWLGDAECHGLRSGGRPDADIAHESGDGSLHTTAAHRTGPTNGLWANADWLRCTDGKWRAVEPGTFPLAHGVSGRVGRLRAYGNAIVPQQAAQFIGAFIDAQAQGEVRDIA